MTPKQLASIGPSLYPKEDRSRWQSLLARDLGVTSRAVRFWLQGKRKISEPTARLIESLNSARKSEQTQHRQEKFKKDLRAERRRAKKADSRLRLPA